MNDLKLLLTVANREQEESFLELFRHHGVETVFTFLCSGTASKSMLDYLGIEKNEKLMMLCVADAENTQRLCGDMVSRLGINMHGVGIAFSIPVGSIGGITGLKYLTQGQESIGEVNKMYEYDYTLVVAICQGGFNTAVMDAARSAGARGGTVVHAKGTGNEFTAKFFGVSIADEKEIVLIICKKSEKDGIMRAIMEQAGISKPAGAVVLSLPVDTVAGLSALESGQ